jgi:hypothetical protein
MIKKTLIYTLILFLLYNLVIYFWNPQFASPQGFWQDNQVKAQDYIYTGEYDNAENVIVGSSMSFRIPADSLRDFCNLSFLGENYIKGLELLEKKGNYPKRIFIETNFPAGKTNEGLFYDILYNPVLYPSRTYLPALRDGKQPLLLTASKVEECFTDNSIKEEDRDKYSAIFKRMAEPTPGVGLFQGFGQEVSPEDIKKQLSDLDIFLDKMKSHNTEIIFFEMPLYKTLYNSPRVTGIRKAFEEHYPPEQYTYLPRPGYDEYQTLDGLHLGKAEAIQFARKFRIQVDSLVQAGK